MKYKNIFELVGTEFKKAAIPVAIGGGYAINYYKVSRNTADIDFLIQDKDAQRAGEILEKFGYKKFHQNELFARFEISDFRFIPVDLMFLDEKTFSGILKEGKRIEILDYLFVVPSLDHLLAMKIHAMKGSPERRFYKDMPDIVNLVKQNNLKIESEHIRNLFLKYGNRELYDQVLSVLKGGSHG